jgi:hypothetical protein
MHYLFSMALKLGPAGPHDRLRLSQHGSTGQLMPFSSNLLPNLSKVFFLTLAGFAMYAMPVHAQGYLSGTYKCVNVQVAGKSQPCSAPSLELNSDGSYQILAERGTYKIVSSRWLVLSTSKNHGKARLDGSKEIIFEFISGGKKNTITYRRKYERPTGWVAG